MIFKKSKIKKTFSLVFHCRTELYEHSLNMQHFSLGVVDIYKRRRTKCRHTFYQNAVGTRSYTAVYRRVFTS